MQCTGGLAKGLPKGFSVSERKDAGFGGGPTNFNRVARCYLKEDSQLGTSGNNTGRPLLYSFGLIGVSWPPSRLWLSLWFLQSVARGSPKDLTSAAAGTAVYLLIYLLTSAFSGSWFLSISLC